MDIEKQYEWSKKSKRYKTKYLAALQELFGDDDENIDEKAENLIKDERSKVNCDD